MNRGKQKERLKSTLFNYYESKRTLVYKNISWRTKSFQLFFARQFKRGLFEMFLQTYHYKTGNGLDPKFDSIRRFARFNEGDAKLFYGLNRGIYLVAEDYMEHPFFPMSDSCIKEIENYGFYTLYLNDIYSFLRSFLKQRPIEVHTSINYAKNIKLEEVFMHTYRRSFT